MNAERAEAALWAAFLRNRNVDAKTSADGAVPLAGGFGLCLAGTFLEYGIGVGSTRALRPDDLRVLREFYGRRGLPARLELDEAVLARDRALLAAEGYAEDGLVLAVLERTTAAEAALVRGGPPVQGGAPVEEIAAAEGIAVRAVSDRRAWTELVVRAFEDTVGPADHDRLRRAIQANAASAQRLFVAALDGHDVGGGAVALAGDLAFLYSSAVLPAQRGRGAYRALLGARLAFGQAEGVGRAAFKTSPGSGAERAALQLGFARTGMRRHVRRSDV